MAKNKNTKMKKTRGSITNIDFIDGHIKVELQDEDLIVGTAEIDLANLPYPVVDNVMGELMRYVEEIPEVVKVAEKYFDEYTEPYGASTKKFKIKKSDSQYRVYDESGEEYVGDKGTILNVVGNMLDGLDLPLVGRGSVTLTFECMDNSGYEASAKKSKIKKAFLSWNVSGLQSALGDAEYAYMDWHDSGIPSNDDESRLYNEIESDIDELTDKINEYIGVLNDLMAGHEDDYEASAKKSQNTTKSFTKSFNSMVQDIRSKNNTKKVM